MLCRTTNRVAPAPQMGQRGCPPSRSGSADPVVLAQLSEVARADVLGLLATVRDHVLHVVDGDRLRREQDRGNVAVALAVVDRAGGLGLAAGGERDRRVSERTGLL